MAGASPRGESATGSKVFGIAATGDGNVGLHTGPRLSAFEFGNEIVMSSLRLSAGGGYVLSASKSEQPAHGGGLAGCGSEEEPNRSQIFGKREMRA